MKKDTRDILVLCVLFAISRSIGPIAHPFPLRRRSHWPPIARWRFFSYEKTYSCPATGSFVLQKAERLPSLTLNITPAEYYRDITKRYDSQKKTLTNTVSNSAFYAGGNLKIKQNFDMLGGSFFVDTDLGYMRYFGSNTYNQFTSVPIRIGYSQDLLGYNPFRWGEEDRASKNMRK